jgi:hypothetical protein
MGLAPVVPPATPITRSSRVTGGTATFAYVARSREGVWNTFFDLARQAGFAVDSLPTAFLFGLEKGRSEEVERPFRCWYL